MNTGEYETLRNEQRKLEKNMLLLEDHYVELSKQFDKLKELLKEQNQFFSSTLQKHIGSRIAHNASTDITDAMLDIVREGKASMTVSYNLYPVEKGEGNDDT